MRTRRRSGATKAAVGKPKDPPKAVARAGAKEKDKDKEKEKEKKLVPVASLEEDPYRLSLAACSAKDHAKRKNCGNNPNCLFGLGEKKQGIWLAKPKLLKSLPSADPTQFRDLKSGKPCGLQNLGATCYVNALLQCLFMNVHFRKAVYSCDKSIVGDNPVLQELRLVFAKLEMSREKSQSLTKLTSLLGLQTGIQQDATEFTKLFLSYLESSVSRGGAKVKSVDEMLGMFRGKQKNITKCDHCKSESVRDSPFYELSLQLKSHPSLESSIKEYGKVEQLKGLNQYLCNHCKCKRDADRFCRIAELPAVLNLQLMRFIFDLKLFAKKKVKDALEIPKEIDFNDFNNFVDISPKLSSKYKLVAVLHHKGSTAFHGHYTADLFDPRAQSWWTFDDETVCAMAEDQSSNERPTIHGSAGSRTAYMLVYMRADMLESTTSCSMPSDLSETVQKENDQLEQKLKRNKRAIAETEKRIKERKKQYAEAFLDPNHPPFAAENEESFLVSKAWLQRWIDGDPDTPNAPPSTPKATKSENAMVDLSNELSPSPKKAKTETIVLVDSPEAPPVVPAAVVTVSDADTAPENTPAPEGDDSKEDANKMAIDIVENLVDQATRPRATGKGAAAQRAPSRVNPSRRAKDAYRSEKAVLVMLQEDKKRQRKEQNGQKKKRHKSDGQSLAAERGAPAEPASALGRHLWSEPIKQSHLPCEHGAATLSPESMKAVKRVSLHTWTQLLKYAGGSDVVFSSKAGFKCEECVKKLFEDKRKVEEDSMHWEHIAVILQNQNADEELGIISRKWVAKFKTIYRQRETLIKKDKSLPFESDQQKVNIFSKGLANYASLVPEDLKDLNKEITCDHGNLRPGKNGKRLLSMKDLEFIRTKALQGSCQDSRIFTSKSEVCKICTDKSNAEKEAELEYRKERDEQLKSKEYGSILRKLSKRTSGHPSLNREMNHLEGGMYYVVPCAWFNQWRLYVKEGFQVKPPCISVAVRDTLLCSHRKVRVSPRLIQWLEGERTRAMQLLDPQTVGDHEDECEIVSEKEWKALVEFNSDSRRAQGVMFLLCEAQTWEEGERRKFDFQPELCEECMQQRKELHSLALSHFDHKIFEFIRLFNGQKPPDAEESKTNTNRRSKRARGNSKSKYSVSVSSSDKISLVKLKLWEVLNDESINVNDIRVYRKGEAMEGDSTIGGHSIKVGERLYFDTLLKGNALDASTEADIISSALPQHGHTREIGFSGTALTLS